MDIYTRTGDSGETSLAHGGRVSKAHLRVEAYGTVDEANSAVGLARAAVDDRTLDGVLDFIQQRLFNCSSSLAGAHVHGSPGAPAISDSDIVTLERAVDRFADATAGERGFVLTGGCETACRLHLARAIVRRAERRAIELAAQEDVERGVLVFLNRTSDALFAAAIYANATSGVDESRWLPDAPPPEL